MIVANDEWASHHRKAKAIIGRQKQMWERLSLVHAIISHQTLVQRCHISQCCHISYCCHISTLPYITSPVSSSNTVEKRQTSFLIKRWSSVAIYHNVAVYQRCRKISHLYLYISSGNRESLSSVTAFLSVVIKIYDLFCKHFA